MNKRLGSKTTVQVSLDEGAYCSRGSRDECARWMAVVSAMEAKESAGEDSYYKNYGWLDYFEPFYQYYRKCINRCYNNDYLENSHLIGRFTIRFIKGDE